MIPEKDKVLPTGEKLRTKVNLLSDAEFVNPLDPPIRVGTGVNMDMGSYQRMLGKDFKPSFGLDYNNALIQQKLEAIERAKAENQTFIEEWGNAIAGGIAKGAFTILENAGYLGDVLEWTGLADEEDGEYTNWLSELAKSGKEAVGEYFKIHRDRPETGTFDWFDSSWWAIQTQGLIESAVGYGVTGLGAAAQFGRLAKLLTLARLGNRVEKLGQTLAGASAMNYSESKMMSVELYGNLINQGVDKKIAAREAQKFLLQNKINILTDFLQFKSLYRGLNYTRNLQKEGFKNLALEQMKEAGKEAFEEVSAGFLQKEGERRGRISAGLEKDDKSSYLGRVIEYLSTPDAQLEAFLGALGGPVQSAIINTPMKKLQEKLNPEAAKWEKEYKERQTSTIADTETALVKTLNKFAERQKAKQEAILKGEDSVVKQYEQEDVAEIALRNFKAGTTEKLYEQYDRIANLSKEEAAKEGFEGDYASKAREAKLLTERMEKDYIKARNRLEANENPEIADLIVKTKYALEFSNNNLIKIKNKVKNLEAQLNNQLKELKAEQKTSIRQLEQDMADTQYRMISLNKLKINNWKKQKTGHKEFDATLDENIKAAELQIAEGEKILKELKEKYEEVQLVDPQTLLEENPLTEELNAAMEEESHLTQINDIYKKAYKQLSTPEGRKKLREENAKVLRETAEAKKNEHFEELKKQREQEKQVNSALKKKEEEKNQETFNPTLTDEEAEIIDNPFKGTGGEFDDSVIDDEQKESKEELTEEEDEEQELISDLFSEQISETKETAPEFNPVQAADVVNETKTNETNIIVSDKSALAENNQIEKTINEADPVTSFDEETESYLTRDIATAVAYGHTKEYASDESGRILGTIGSEFSGEVFNPLILSDNKLPIGTKLKARKVTKEEFSKMFPNWEADTNMEDIAEPGTLLDYDTVELGGYKYFPIVLETESGEQVGFLHGMNYINPTRVHPDALETEANRLEALRKRIYNGEEIIFTIDSRTHNVLSKQKGSTGETFIASPTATQYGTTSNMLPNVNNIGIAFGSKELRKGSQSSSQITGINDKFEFSPGGVYAIVEAGTQSYPIRLNHKRLGDTRFKDSIINLFEAYATRHSSKSADAVCRELGIETDTDLIEFISQFINTFDFRGLVDPKTNTIQLNNNNPNTAYTYFDGNNFLFGYPGGKVYVWAISSREGKKMPPQVREQLETVLEYAYININARFLEKTDIPFNSDIITKNKNGEFGIERHSSSYIQFIKDNTYTNVKSYEISFTKDGKEYKEDKYFDSIVVRLKEAPKKKEAIKINKEETKVKEKEVTPKVTESTPKTKTKIKISKRPSISKEQISELPASKAAALTKQAEKLKKHCQ